MSKPNIKIRPSKRTGFVVAFVLVLAGTLIYAVHQVRAPVYGTITKQAVSSKQTTAANYISLSNNYLDMLYPNDFTADLSSSRPAEAVDYHYFTVKDAKGKPVSELEIFVKSIRKGEIVLDSDYKNYQSQPSKYKLSNEHYQNEAVVLATSKKGPLEKAALWEHQNYLLTIKLKSTDLQSKEAEEMIGVMLGSVNWAKR